MDEKTVYIKSEPESVMQGKNEIGYLLDSCSDIGITKNVNQDACCIRILKTPLHTIVLAAVCDGVGGMSEGEFASKSTVQALNNWFDYDLSKVVLKEEEPNLFLALSEGIKEITHKQNRAILEYGRQKNICIGTTLTAILFVDQEYFIVQIGDSRAYCIKDELLQLTEDQSLVAKEVRDGRLTEEEARHDKRRNIILQCLGVTENIFPVYQNGIVQKETSYFVCSDGLVHELEKDELKALLNPQNITSACKMHEKLLEAIEIVKGRGEKDNITVVLVRTL